MKKVYKSKIGFELVIPILLVVIFSFYNIIVEQKISGILILIFILAFISYIFLSIKYTIIDKNLNIKGGFLVNENIDIAKINKIEKSFNILASPAASLDRIEIKYGNGNSILISPKHKSEFISDLKKINPNIEIKN